MLLNMMIRMKILPMDWQQNILKIFRFFAPHMLLFFFLSVMLDESCTLKTISLLTVSEDYSSDYNNCCERNVLFYFDVGWWTKQANCSTAESCVLELSNSQSYKSSYLFLFWKVKTMPIHLLVFFVMAFCIVQTLMTSWGSQHDMQTTYLPSCFYSFPLSIPLIMGHKHTLRAFPRS